MRSRVPASRSRVPGGRRGPARRTANTQHVRDLYCIVCRRQAHMSGHNALNTGHSSPDAARSRRHAPHATPRSPPRNAEGEARSRRTRASLKTLSTTDLEHSRCLERRDTRRASARSRKRGAGGRESPSAMARKACAKPRTRPRGPRPAGCAGPRLRAPRAPCRGGRADARAVSSRARERQTLGRATSGHIACVVCEQCPCHARAISRRTESAPRGFPQPHVGGAGGQRFTSTRVGPRQNPSVTFMWESAVR